MWEPCHECGDEEQAIGIHFSAIGRENPPIKNCFWDKAYLWWGPHLWMLPFSRSVYVWFTNCRGFFVPNPHKWGKTYNSKDFQVRPTIIEPANSYEWEFRIYAPLPNLTPKIFMNFGWIKQFPFPKNPKSDGKIQMFFLLFIRVQQRTQKKILKNAKQNNLWSGETRRPRR